MSKKATLGQILGDLGGTDLGVLVKAFDNASCQESDLEPKLEREIEPVRSWLRSRFYNSFAKNLYPYWEDEIVDFCEGEFSEWIITGSLGTGKSSAALIACMRKIYELSCWDYPQRLFRLADMTKIFFAYLSVNLKQADLTGFGQIRSMLDGTPYFMDNFSRDLGINSVLKFPKGLFMIPGSDAISVIGTNLFGSILDEANFLRKSGMSQIGDVAKAQELYAETTDRRRSRFMYKGKDPGFSMLVSSSTVQTSFTSSRIEQAKGDSRVKVTNAALWEVKKDSYQSTSFFVFNGSDKDDPFILSDPNQLSDLIVDPEDRFRLYVESEVLGMESPQDAVPLLMGLLPDFLESAISEVPTDFRPSFETDLYKALRNIAGISIAPVGKLFTSRMLWNRAIASDLFHPFTKATVTIGLQTPEDLASYFSIDRVFGTSAPLRHPSAPRFLHIDMSTTTCDTGIACVHQAGFETNEALGVMTPRIEVDFMLAVHPPKAPDRIAFYKIRSFIILLKRMGMKIGRVTLDQYQSEDTIQLLTKARVPSGRVSLDRNDKPYLSLVNLLSECRISIYDYEPFKRELFGLDHDRERGKVDHPDVNTDGSAGSKDVSDAVAAAVFTCLEAGGSSAFERMDALNKIKVSTPESKYGRESDMSWILPKEYRGKVKVEKQIVGGGAWGLETIPDNE